MKLMNTIAATAIAAFVLALSGAVSPPAVADTASSAAMAAAVGAIGSLLFDSSKHQYYYVRNNRRTYVDNGTARQYYQHKDPHFYAAHQRDFSNQPDKFSHDWNQQHH